MSGTPFGRKSYEKTSEVAIAVKALVPPLVTNELDIFLDRLPVHLSFFANGFAAMDGNRIIVFCVGILVGGCRESLSDIES